MITSAAILAQGLGGRRAGSPWRRPSGDVCGHLPFSGRAGGFSDPWYWRERARQADGAHPNRGRLHEHHLAVFPPPALPRRSCATASSSASTGMVGATARFLPLPRARGRSHTRATSARLQWPSTSGLLTCGITSSMGMPSLRPPENPDLTEDPMRAAIDNIAAG